MFSLDHNFIGKILTDTLPSYQITDPPTANLGFGFLFYGLVRVLRPKTMVIIGSKKGFAPVVFGIGAKDNEGVGHKTITDRSAPPTSTGSPEIFFVDPSYSVHRKDADHWYGIGAWDEESVVTERWRAFGIESIIRHFKMRSDEFAISELCPANIDLLFIDGDHSFSGIATDLTMFSRRMKRDAIIVMHDVAPGLARLLPNSGGYEVLQEFVDDRFEYVRIPVFPGLAIMRLRR